MSSLHCLASPSSYSCYLCNCGGRRSIQIFQKMSLTSMGNSSLIKSLAHMLVRKLFQLYLALCLRRTRMSSLYFSDCAVRGGIGLPSLTLQGPVKQIAHWGPALEVGRLPSFMHACSSDELVLNFDVSPPPPTCWCCGEMHRFTQRLVISRQ